jgi:hypothetical protein
MASALIVSEPPNKPGQREHAKIGKEREAQRTLLRQLLRSDLQIARHLSC